MDERIRSGLKELRLFALGFGASFGVLAWRLDKPSLYGVMAALWLLGAVYPKALSPLHHVLQSALVKWMPTAFLYNFYWFTLTPYAWVLRVFGTPMLDEKLDGRATYWVAKEPVESLDAYRRQF